MSTEQQHLRTLFAKHAREALAKVKGNRLYASSAQSEAELTSFALAYRDHVMENAGRFDLEELSKLYGELSQIDALNLVQKRPPAEIELKPICDPVTGLPIRNPFSDPPDLTSQMLLEKENPELAKYYRDTKDGTTFAMVAKIKAEREARDKIRGIVYGQKEHAQNPFLLSGKEGLKAQSEFVRGNEHQPHLVNWYQHEAKATPTLDFNNLTTRQLVSKRSPIVGAIFEKARQLHAHFLREDQARLEAEVAERQGQLQATQRQLASAR